MSELVKLLSALLGRPAMDAEFKESDHPRDKDGKFGSGGGGKVASKVASAEFGEAFTAYSGKPAEAIEHLLKEKRGHVPAAFNKEGLGDIDLPYGKTGKDGFGLAHIIERRNQDGMNGNAFIRELPQIIRDGEVTSDPRFPDRKYVVNNKKRAVIRLDLDGEKRNWLVTAYADTKSPGAMDGLRTTIAHAYDGKRYLPLPHSGEVNKNIGSSRLRVNGDRIAFDRASQRRFDENGFLHVAMTPISKEAVNDYYGYEIPGWQKLGLDPNRIYKGYRPASELAKAAATFNGLPLLKEHVKISAEDLKEELRAGNLGTAAKFVAPYLYNALIIQDSESIEGLNPKDGQPAKCELSSSYRYDPVFKPGVFQGQRYDFIMTNIRGNHVALVEEGRAGPDVVVADAKPITPRGSNMSLLDDLKELLAKLTEGGATPHPGGEEEAAAFMEADDNDPAAVPAEESANDDEAGDLGTKLFALIDGMEDKELAAKLKELVEQARAESGGAASAAPVGDEDETAKDEDGEKEKDKPAMDGKKKRPAYKAGPAKLDKKTGNVVINMAMDAKAVAAEIRDGFKAQIEAARDVRPLIGDVDPLAFDSAAQIYGRALNLIGKPSKLTDPKALKELCALAADAKRGKSVYPVVSSVLANDSKGDADPAFANLGNIRKA